MASSASPSLITLAFLAFFSTTVDDFAVVLIFFGKEYVKTHDITNPKTRNAFISIIIGQILGFTLIVSIALGIGVGLRATIKEGYIDLIGFLPILLGLYKIYEILDELKCFDAICNSIERSKESEDEPISAEDKDEIVPLIVSSNSAEEGKTNLDDEKKIVKESGYTNLAATSKGNGYETFGAHKDTDKVKDESSVEEESVNRIQESTVISPPLNNISCRDSLIEEVAMYALMFGIDNIAIYVSLLSNLSNEEIVGSIVVFYSLLCLYLIIAALVVLQVSFEVTSEA